MAMGIFGSVLAVAWVFMVYALVQFHVEGRRPRRSVPRVPKGVIAFQKSSVVCADRGQRRKIARRPLESEVALPDEMTTALPAGLRRLTSKRDVRS